MPSHVVPSLKSQSSFLDFGVSTQMDTAALTSLPSTAVIQRGTVSSGQSGTVSSGQSDVSHLAARTQCLNYHQFLGAHNYKKSLAMKKFRDALKSQENKVARLQGVHKNKLEKLQETYAKSQESWTTWRQKKKVMAAESALPWRRSQERAAYHKLNEASGVLREYQTALNNCLATGYSDPSKIPPVMDTSPSQIVDMSPSASAAPDQEYLAIEDQTVMVGVDSGAGPVDLPGVVVDPTNGQVTMYAPTATPMQGGLFSPRNLALGALAVGLGYVFLRRRA